MALTNLQSHPDYERAIDCLRNKLTDSDLVQDLIKMSIRERRPDKILTMTKRYLQRAGIQSEDLDKMPFIHIAGSKGKGSSTILTETILRHHGYKTGMIVSPHFHETRERISINGKPISKDKFSHYFWDVFKKLENSTVGGELEEGGCMPTYLDMLLVLGMRVFISEQVDVVVMEVGVGGRFDRTNFMRQPVVCGITPLAMEHTETLGATLEKIAWHKAGIIKPGRPVVTQPQKPEALQVILDSARENKSPVYIAAPLPSDYQDQYKFTLGLTGDVQLGNTGLALQLFRIFKAWKEGEPSGFQTYGEIPPTIADIPVLECGHPGTREIEGLANCRSFGRTQHVRRGKVSYFIDFAGTEDSMHNFVTWFRREAGAEASTISGKVARVLLFNCDVTKDHKVLLSILKELKFDAACFPFRRICDEEPLSEHSDRRYQKYVYDNFRRHVDWMKSDWDMITEIGTNGQENSENFQCRENQGAHEGEKTTEIPEFQSQTFECALHALVWATQGKDPELASHMAAPREVLPPAPAAMREADHIQVVVVSSSNLVGIALALTVPNLLDR